MNPALVVAWGLTAFVVVAGVVGWIVTGQASFAVYVVLGLLAALAAFVISRPAPSSSSKEQTP